MDFCISAPIPIQTTENHHFSKTARARATEHMQFTDYSTLQTTPPLLCTSSSLRLAIYGTCLFVRLLLAACCCKIYTTPTYPHECSIRTAFGSTLTYVYYKYKCADICACSRYSNLRVILRPSNSGPNVCTHTQKRRVPTTHHTFVSFVQRILFCIWQWHVDIFGGVWCSLCVCTRGCAFIVVLDSGRQRLVCQGRTGRNGAADVGRCRRQRQRRENVICPTVNAINRNVYSVWKRTSRIAESD